jgi:tellurite methyltransferase
MTPIDLLPACAPLLLEYAELFATVPPSTPILDVACGDGRNGIFLALRGHSVICCDYSAQSLRRATEFARESGVTLSVWHVDLELPGNNPFPPHSFGGIMVFRYLHRPLIPCIRKALREGGILMYETYTLEQPRYGKPHNPDFLLRPGELLQWFMDWKVLHHFEGVRENPTRAVAQIVCRKPGGTSE